MGTGENLGLQPRGPTLQGGAHQQKPQEQGPTAVSLLPQAGLSHLQGCLAARSGAEGSNVFIWYIHTVSPLVR